MLGDISIAPITVPGPGQTTKTTGKQPRKLELEVKLHHDIQKLVTLDTWHLVLTFVRYEDL
jgi:hypothetical protein